MLLENSLCSFLATPPDTKIPRCPTLSCTVYTMRSEGSLIETGRQHIDQVDVAGKFVVLLLGDPAGYENSKVPDALMHGVHDGLAERPDLIDIVVEVENPVERLLRRGDVVAFRAEYHDRRANIAQIDGGAVRYFDASGGEIIADEKLIDDELDFLGIEVDVPAPPALELEISRRFGIDFGINVILFGPKRVCRILIFKILHQPAAIEFSAADIAGKSRQPATAE